MKLRIDLTALAAAVADAARALPARPPIPVLAGLKLEATAGELTIVGYDYDVCTRAALPADVSLAGSALVSGRLLADITRTVKGKNTVDLELDGSRLILTTGTLRYTLHTLPLEEYPSLPTTSETNGTVAGSEFAKAVAQVAIAAGRDDTLPVLTGIQVAITPDGKATLSSTDRYRFAVRRLNFAAHSPCTTTALLPAKGITDTVKALAEADRIDVTLPDDQGIVTVSGPTRSTTMRALDGKLPDPANLWPKEDDVTATAIVDSQALTAAVKRVALVTTRGIPVRLDFTPGALTLSANGSDNAQARDRVDADFTTKTGAPFTIAFNPSFLLDGLTAIATPAVTLRMTTPTKPALITSANSDGTSAADDALTYLLMPIRQAT